MENSLYSTTNTPLKSHNANIHAEKRSADMLEIPNKPFEPHLSKRIKKSPLVQGVFHWRRISSADTSIQKYQLMKDVGFLKAHVEALENVRNNLRETSSTTCMQKSSMCTEIFQIWGVGHNQSVPVDIMNNQQDQLLFLTNMMHENVVHITSTSSAIQQGIESLLNEWTQFCWAHAYVDVLSSQAHVIQSSPSTVVQITSILKVVFSQNTITAFYPSILDDPQSVQELIGMETSIVIKRSFSFNEIGKCVFVKTDMEILAGLVNALRSVEDAVELLACSTIQNSAFQSWNPELSHTMASSDCEIICSALACHMQ